MWFYTTSRVVRILLCDSNIKLQSIAAAARGDQIMVSRDLNDFQSKDLNTNLPNNNSILLDYLVKVLK